MVPCFRRNQFFCVILLSVTDNFHWCPVALLVTNESWHFRVIHHVCHCTAGPRLNPSVTVRLGFVWNAVMSPAWSNSV